ncbi:acyl carrier protein [Alkaliphilus transvaalensis]|uniref:acyl carrier protein n=1 Tax=Alkaliphilus transvaalensis TaxID=114628 RepID=UPI0004787FA8|nr:phosphopantetheine-binding protein [Alkaliphilus transvaalensis]
MKEVKGNVKKFLSRFYRQREIEDHEDIFALGFVNSLFAMQLVMFIEKEFNIKIDNKDLNFENFRTIDSIVAFVDARST